MLDMSSTKYITTFLIFSAVLILFMASLVPLMIDFLSEILQSLTSEIYNLSKPF